MESSEVGNGVRASASSLLTLRGTRHCGSRPAKSLYTLLYISLPTRALRRLDARSYGYRKSYRRAAGRCTSLFPTRRPSLLCQPRASRRRARKGGGESPPCRGNRLVSGLRLCHESPQDALVFFVLLLNEGFAVRVNGAAFRTSMPEFFVAFFFFRCLKSRLEDATEKREVDLSPLVVEKTVARPLRLPRIPDMFSSWHGGGGSPRSHAENEEVTCTVLLWRRGPGGSPAGRGRGS